LNHYTWTYVGDNGYSAIVGLYHSSKSGHVMIYVDKKIVVVDFSIRDSKTYTFFINDELCEVKLERKDLKMVYTFEINQDANTPRNQQRKKEEKKHLKQSFAFFGLVLLGIILAAFYFSTTLKNQKSTVQLLQNPSKSQREI
jgi:uncharacterized protein YpmB